MTPASASDEDVSCRTKVPYVSHSEAKRHWKHLRKQPGRQHLVIYECRHCPNWHIGNPFGHQTYRRPGSPYTAGGDTAAPVGRGRAPVTTDDTAPPTPDYDPGAPYTTSRDTAA
ncbi:hypothetical protein ACGF3G_00730 [Streptomyces sp. NPDC048179]|uniref:hypothetical protein n=1 Tax=Streptomyces sp. NPDC048179 TaxID=3365506 RepID=UPI0037249006